MRKGYIFGFCLFVFFMSGCTRAPEERSIRNFLALWADLRPFYINKVGIIASRGFLNPSLVSVLHEDLLTNTGFCNMVTQRFRSVEEYVDVFSNVTIHYVFLSFTENLAGRSPDVVMRELDDVFVKIETIPDRQMRKQKRKAALLLRTRLEEYKTVRFTVSSNWIRAVYRHAKELGQLYESLVSTE